MESYLVIALKTFTICIQGNFLNLAFRKHE